MDVSNINANLLNSLNFKDLLGKNGNGVLNYTMPIENNVAASTVNMTQNFTNVVSSPNMMSRNFAGATSQSRYVEATV